MRDFVVAEPSLLHQRRRLLRTRVTRDVDATPENVWQIVSDHTTWSDWHTDYDEHRAVAEQTEGLGARFLTTEWILKSESEITRWEPGHTIGLSVTRATGWRWLLRSHYTEIRVEPAPDGGPGARLHYGVAFTGTLLFWVLSAYSIGYALASSYWDAKASLKSLDRLLSEST